MTTLDEKLNLILGNYEREFDRCDGSYKYYRKIVTIIERLEGLKDKDGYKWGGENFSKGFNAALSQAIKVVKEIK